MAKKNPALKDGWVSITYPGGKPKAVKQGSKAHVNAMDTNREDGRPSITKLASKGARLTAKEQKQRGIPGNAPTVKAQAKGEDKAVAKGDDK